MRRIRSFFLMLATLVVSGLFSCKTEFEGEQKLNRAPETYMLADTIARTGDLRYKTQVQVQWWGTDPDGFIAAYEISPDGNNWFSTSGQDSTFSLTIPANTDTFDFRFYVRAIDNTGTKDASPASLTYPVKNSAPDVKFIFSGTRNPVRSFPAIKYTWQASDPDGNDNLDHVELYLNDTNAPVYVVPASVTSVSFVAKNVSGSITDCDVYTGVSTIAQPSGISGMKLNDTNYIFLRVADKVNAKSAFKVAKIFIRKPASGTLLVNAITAQFPANIKTTYQNFYSNQLSGIGITGYDVLRSTDIDGTGNYLELSPDPQTQARVFTFFKKIFWFSDDPDFSFSLAQKSTDPFFNAGGKLFMVVGISSNIDPLADYLNFTPISSLVTPPVTGSLFFSKDSLLTPFVPGWPTLRCSSTLSSARPFNIPMAPSSLYSYDTLYRGAFTFFDGTPQAWTGTAHVVAKRSVIATGKANFIICSVPLDKMNGYSNIGQFFQKALIDELAF